jgi:hypothetical protein
MRNKNKILFHAPTSKRINRNELPSAAVYYSNEFPEMKITSSQWVKVCCCFHTDSNPSLSINILSGGFYCFSCGAKGGDVISFVMQRYQLTFKKACQQLGVCL